ncbi:MAG: glycosyltransferase family 2 protein, partial [Micrococcaceae bacterium]|nr:glycosyltransferase family 2 protein [Micrococcaceae bacterium]
MTSAIFIFAIFILGLTTVLWSSVGLIRVLTEKSPLRQRQRLTPGKDYPDISQVAILIAAHNEELVINKTIASATALLPASQIFVASDGSTDATVQLVGSAGANVVDLNPNRGKAGALSAAIDHFELAKHFEVVMLLDADTQLASDYFTTGLPMFADPEVVAVAGRARTLLDPAPSTIMGKILVAYRERLYQVVQVLVKFGQAAPKVNVVSIVPGFASMYRSRILHDIDIAAKGLTIEDFNMTFEVHAKKLGRIAFHPNAAIAYTQDPDNFRDYTRQVRRWTLGFWQTVRRHGFHLGKFWFAVGVYVFELVTSSLMFLVLVPAAIVSGLAGVLLARSPEHDPTLYHLSGLLPPYLILFGVIAPDLILTIFAAIMTRRISYLLMAPAFPVMRVVDA